MATAKIAPGQTDTFQHGTDNWNSGESHPEGPQATWMPSGGPGGGPFLQIGADGSGPPNHKNQNLKKTPALAMNNGDQWAGDYSGIGESASN